MILGNHYVELHKLFDIVEPPLCCIKVHIFWEGHKICKIFTLLLTVCTVVKSKVKISQNFVAFSEYMNFKELGDSRIPGTSRLISVKI